jgi:hypothetical protein
MKRYESCSKYAFYWSICVQVPRMQTLLFSQKSISWFTRCYRNAYVNMMILQSSLALQRLGSCCLSSLTLAQDRQFAALLLIFTSSVSAVTCINISPSWHVCLPASVCWYKLWILRYPTGTVFGRSSQFRSVHEHPFASIGPSVIRRGRSSQGSNLPLQSRRSLSAMRAPEH